jgi:hypothetical protein
MEVIQPTPIEKRQTLEDVRENLIESWGEDEYYQELEKQVKKNHSDIFKFVEKYPTYTLGYSVISELYKLEETIFNTRHFVVGLESYTDFTETRSV